MHKVLCFGELLLRFSPRLNRAWIDDNSMPVYIGGAELNVSKALAKWSIPVSYCTALPVSYLSEEIVQDIKHRAIETDKIIYSGKRIGSYFLPADADLKHASVIYDREHSSYSELQPGTIDWEKILEGITWFHFSAISPALNKNIATICEEALKAARKKNITISVDLNYRSKLWQYGKQPIEVMPKLVQYCDVIMGNIWAKETMLGITLSKDISNTNADYLEHSLSASRQLIKLFPACRQVANTFRFDVDKGVKYFASLYTEENMVHSAIHTTDHIIDKVGSGDTFMAGLIYGNIQSFGQQQIIDFAAAAAFNKLFIKGDATTSAVEDICKMIPQ